MLFRSGFDLAITFDDGGEEPALAFRTRLLHAMALGVPVLATRGEFVADLAGARGAGWTVDPRDADAIASTITRLHDDRAALRQAGQAARELAAAFDYPRLVEPLADWIDDDGMPRRVRPAQLPLQRRLRRVFGQRLH